MSFCSFLREVSIPWMHCKAHLCLNPYPYQSWQSCHKRKPPDKNPLQAKWVYRSLFHVVQCVLGTYEFTFFAYGGICRCQCKEIWRIKLLGSPRAVSRCCCVAVSGLQILLWRTHTGSIATSDGNHASWFNGANEYQRDAQQHSFELCCVDWRACSLKKSIRYDLTSTKKLFIQSREDHWTKADAKKTKVLRVVAFKPFLVVINAF